MQAAGGKRLSVPVYCSFDARKNTKVIINIFPDDDRGVIALANLRKGILERDAVPMTQSWQEHLGFPRLAEDEQFGRLLGAEEQDNFQMSEILTVADANIRFQSLVKPGIDQHSSVHSRRVGSIVGRLLRDPKSTQSLDYIETLVQLSDADQGEPISLDAQSNWEQAHATDFEQVGWRLRGIKVSLAPEARVGTGSLLSLRVVEEHNGIARTVYQSAMARSGTTAQWNTNNILFDGREQTLVLFAGKSLGEYRLNGKTRPPVALRPDIEHNVLWSAELDWVSVHY